MTNETLFQTEPDQATFDESKNYLEELVGEGKKFKDIEALAKGKAYADSTIETLTRRLDELRSDYTKTREENISKAKLEDLIDKLSRPQQQTHQEPPVKEEAQPLFDPKQVENLISNKIQEFESTKKYQENFNQVKNKAQEVLGTNYQTVLKQRTNDLGLTDNQVNDLARNSPQALIRMLGLEQQNTAQQLSAPRSSQRNDSFAPKVAAKRTWSYYQDLKKKDPNAWYDPKIGAQMAQDAVELGSAFRDGDYFVKNLHDENSI